MGWTLTHRFLTGAGLPASGWVYLAVDASPSLTPIGTYVSTGERIKLDRTGAFLVNDLPAGVVTAVTVWVRIDKGDPFVLGPVTVPVQAEGDVVDLGELITSWPSPGSPPPGGFSVFPAVFPLVLA